MTHSHRAFPRNLVLASGLVVLMTAVGGCTISGNQAWAQTAASIGPSNSADVRLSVFPARDDQRREDDQLLPWSAATGTATADAQARQIIQN